MSTLIQLCRQYSPNLLGKHFYNPYLLELMVMVVVLGVVMVVVVGNGGVNQLKL